MVVEVYFMNLAWILKLVAILTILVSLLFDFNPIFRVFLCSDFA